MIEESYVRKSSLDNSSNTKLLDKHYSPLIVRKYMVQGWPMYIGMICDENLSSLDSLVNSALERIGEHERDLQTLRNVTGYISDFIIEHYNGIRKGCVEGVAVLWYVDKCFIASLWGDFMTHASCKMELYQIVNTLPHI
jgi:hypothetical protein